MVTGWWESRRVLSLLGIASAESHTACVNAFSIFSETKKEKEEKKRKKRKKKTFQGKNF